MMYDLLTFEVAQERYNDLRRESEHERLVRQVAQPGRSLTAGMHQISERTYVMDIMRYQLVDVARQRHLDMLREAAHGRLTAQLGLDRKSLRFMNLRPYLDLSALMSRIAVVRRAKNRAHPAKMADIA